MPMRKAACAIDADEVHRLVEAIWRKCLDVCEALHRHYPAGTVHGLGAQLGKLIDDAGRNGLLRAVDVRGLGLLPARCPVLVEPFGPAAKSVSFGGKSYASAHQAAILIATDLWGTLLAGVPRPSAKELAAVTEAQARAIVKPNRKGVVSRPDPRFVPPDRDAQLLAAVRQWMSRKGNRRARARLLGMLVSEAVGATANRDHTPAARSPATRERKRAGRRLKPIAAEDQRIAEAWGTRRYKTYFDLADNLGTGYTASKVRMALDRVRKRKPKCASN